MTRGKLRDEISVEEIVNVDIALPLVVVGSEMVSIGFPSLSSIRYLPVVVEMASVRPTWAEQEHSM